MEGDLLQRYLGGELEAFDALVREHEGSLLRYARRLTGCPDAARDVVQETFLKLVQHARELAPEGAWVTWLYRVCRNGCADRARKESRMQLRHERAASPVAVLPDPCGLEAEEEQDTVRSLLAGLDEEVREVLLLKVREGRTYREIASITGLSLHKVSASIHLGLRRLSVGLRQAGLA